MFSPSTTLKTFKLNLAQCSLLIALSFCFFAFSITPPLAQNKIAVSVNKGVVTSYQITQRARFLRLTGFKGDSVAKAREQLVTEELQLQEAKRVELEIRPTAVEQAFANLAKGNRTTPANFEKALRGRGINPDTLKQFIKARITWQQYVVSRARTEKTIGPKEKLTDVTSILFNKNSGGENRLTKEYTIDQYVFIVSNGTDKKLAQQRLREVEAFRRAHSTCDQASRTALNLTSSGVVKKPLGRFTATTLPEAIKEDILAAGDALFTKPKRQEAGIEVMAICKTREVIDNSVPTTDPNGLDIGRLDNKELQEKSEKWMADIRETATIRNH